MRFQIGRVVLLIKNWFWVYDTELKTALKRHAINDNLVTWHLSMVICYCKQIEYYKSKLSRIIKYNFWRLRDELVGNCYSDGTLERLAVHLGLLKDYLRFLAGDLSHSTGRSVGVFAPFIFRIPFRLIYSCKLIKECPFLGVSCCCIRQEIRFHIFLATSKGCFLVVFRIWRSTVWILGILS